MRKQQQESLEITAGMMVEAINRQGGKKIRVQVGSYGTAFTDGNRIAIPTFPDDQRFIGLAYLGHEASHCRVTDMDKFAAFARGGKVHQAVLNIIEDIRIERSITRIYPGLIAQLKNLVHHLVETDQMPAPKRGQHRLEIFIGWLLCSRRAWVLGQSALDNHAKKADRLVRKTFGDRPIDELERDLAVLRTMDITPSGMDEAVALAQRVIDFLKADAQNQKPQQSDDSGDQGQVGQDQGEESQSGGESGDTSDSGDDSNEGESSQGKSSGDDGSTDEEGTSDGSGEPGDGEASDESGSGEGSDSQDQLGQQSDGSGQDGNDEQSSADSMRDPKESNSEEESGEGNENGRGGRGAKGVDPSDVDDYSPRRETDLGKLAEALSASDRGEVSSRFPSMPTHVFSNEELDAPGATMETYHSIIERASTGRLIQSEAVLERVTQSVSWIKSTSRSLAGPVRREMRALLEGEDRVRHDPRRSGRLNRRALAGVATGESRVFHRKIEGKAQRAAVHIMLDASGSMKRRMDSALVSVHSVLEALEPLSKVSTGFSVFPAELSDFDLETGQGRIDCVTSVVKRHEESLSVAKKRHDYFPWPRGSTPMVASMMGVAPILLSQQEERKILIVVTDGSPDEGLDIARHKIDEYRRLGLTIIGVGINAPVTAVSFGEENTVLVDDVSVLPKALKKVVRSAIS